MTKNWPPNNSLTSKNAVEKTVEDLKDTKPGSFGIRHVQALLVFLGLTLAYALRVNLSVAIVAMTDKHSSNPDFHEYKWDEKTKALVLSSFFWGYVITQVPAGQIAQRWGAKLLLLWSMILCSALTLLTPICATIGGWKLVCALRFFEGLCQGVIFPSTHTLLSKWAPVSERAQLATYCYSGAQFGTVVMLSTSGILASSFMGWPSIFYLSGCAGGLWSILWLFFGSNSPSDYKYISAEEREFIQTSLGSGGDSEKKHVKTPWKAIFASMPFWAILVVHSAHNWGFWTLLTEMPTYMKGALGYDIKQNALLSALPYLAMLLMSYFFSFLSGVLERNNCVPLKYSRKLFNSIGHWVPMCALIALGYVTRDEKNLAILLLVLAIGINAATYLGFQVNHIDIAPNHAGTLMGLTNGAANIMSIIAPLLVGFIVNDETNSVQWRHVFFISASIYFVGNLMFVIFSKTEVQSWNDPEHKDEPIHNTHRRGSCNPEAQAGY